MPSESLRGAAPDAVTDLAAGVHNVQSPVAGVQANGSIVYSVNLNVGDTVTMNGVVFTAVAADPAEDEFVVGVDLSTTLDNLVSALGNHDDDALTVAEYEHDGTIVTITFNEPRPVPPSEFSFSSSSGIASGSLADGRAPDVFDVLANSVFALRQVGNYDESLDLPNGQAGQEILVYLEDKDFADIAVAGNYVGGEGFVTFSTVNTYIRLLWTANGWMKVGGDLSITID